MVAHSGEEIGSWVAFDSDPCMECSQRQAASARPDPTSRLSGDRPVKVTYTETPVMSPREPVCSLMVTRLTPGERTRRREEKSHGLVQGLLALAFCILSTFVVCAVATFFGYTSSKSTPGLAASGVKASSAVESCHTLTKERSLSLRATRVKGN